MNRRFRGRTLPWLISLGFLSLLLRRALSPRVLLTRRDAFILYLPIKEFLVAVLHAGRVPTWFPYDGLGVSYVGASIAGLFHPSNLLYLFLPPDQGLKWQALLAYPIAALGAACLARRLGARPAGRVLAAIGFAGSGYLLSVSDNLPYLLTVAVLPWSWLAAERIARKPDWAGALSLACALALATFGGDVQGALLQAISAAAIALLARRKAGLVRLRAVAAAAALTVLITLPQLLPSWAAFRESGRSAGIDWSTASIWSLHPLRVLELALGPLLPTSLIIGASPVVDAIGGMAGAHWAHSELVGMPLCVLALAALLRPLPRRYGPYLVLGASALWLALGRFGRVYSLFFRLVPLWTAFRYPEKLMPFAVLPLCLLASWGLRALTRADSRFTRGLLPVLCAGLGGWFALGSPTQVQRFLRAHLPAAVVPDWPSLEAISQCIRGRAVFGLLLLAAVWLLAVRGGRWTAWFIVALNGTQTLLLSSWLVGVGSRARWLSQDSPFREAALQLQRRGAARMCWALPNYFYTNPELADAEAEVLLSDLRVIAPPLGARARIATVPAYFPGRDAFFDRACGGESACGSACARVAGAGFGVAEWNQRSALQSEQLRVIAEQPDPKSILVEDPLARPFASLPAVRHVAAADAPKAIFDPARRPAEEAILIGPGTDLPAPGGNITADRSTPGVIRAEATLEKPGLAVLAVACARGWRAELDGKPASLEKADGSLCAVELQPGTHHLVLRYRPWGWPWAFGGPMLALALFGLGWQRERRKASRRPSVAARADPP